MSARMNGSVTTDAESDHSTEPEEEQDPVTPRCDALRDLAAVIQEVSYQPALPDNVTRTYLQKVIDYLLLSDYCEKCLEILLTLLAYHVQAGMQVSDPALVNLVSVAAQKFISDIAVDALTHNKMRQSMCGKKSSRKEKKFVMNTEDLMEALKDKGISVKRQPYY